MRIQSSGAAFLLSALLPSLASAITFDCEHINVKGNKYDFKPLGGIHQIAHATSGNETGSYVTNTTYLLDICKPLGKAASSRPEGKCESSKNSASISLSVVFFFFSFSFFLFLSLN